MDIEGAVCLVALSQDLVFIAQVIESGGDFFDVLLSGHVGYSGLWVIVFQIRDLVFQFTDELFDLRDLFGRVIEVSLRSREVRLQPQEPLLFWKVGVISGTHRMVLLVVVLFQRTPRLLEAVLDLLTQALESLFYSHQVLVKNQIYGSLSAQDALELEQVFQGDLEPFAMLLRLQAREVELEDLLEVFSGLVGELRLEVFSRHLPRSSRLSCRPQGRYPDWVSCTVA